MPGINNPFKIFFRSPSYHIQSPGKINFDLDVGIGKQWNWPFKIGQMQISILSSPDGKAVASKTIPIAKSDGVKRVQIPKVDLNALGVYTIKFLFKGPNGYIHETYSLPLDIRGLNDIVSIPLSSKGMPFKAGVPIFPLGLYMAAHDDEVDLERIQEAGFNLLVSYRWGPWGQYQGQIHPFLKSFLDLANDHRLGILFNTCLFYPLPNGICSHPGACDPNESWQSLVGRYVDAIKNHPALVGWYINDEPKPDQVSLNKEMFDLIQKKDPRHPQWVVLMAPEDQNSIIPFYEGFDVLGTDPYPFGPEPWHANDINSVARACDAARISTYGLKPFWAVIQVHTPSAYYGYQPTPPPTATQIRVMAYMAIARGARGIFFFSYFDLFRLLPNSTENEMEIFNSRWPGVASVGKEITQLFPTLLNGKEIVLDGDEIPPDLSIRAWTRGDYVEILIVNSSKEKAHIWQTNMPAGKWKKIEVIQNPQEESDYVSASWKGNKLSIGLDSYGAALVRVKKKPGILSRLFGSSEE